MRKKRFWIDGLCAACCVVIAAAVIGCALPGKKAEAGPAQEVDDSYSKEEVRTLAETADETTVWSACFAQRKSTSRQSVCLRHILRMMRL